MDAWVYGVVSNWHVREHDHAVKCGALSYTVHAQRCATCNWHVRGFSILKLRLFNIKPVSNVHVHVQLHFEQGLLTLTSALEDKHL